MDKVQEYPGRSDCSSCVSLIGFSALHVCFNIATCMKSHIVCLFVVCYICISENVTSLTAT